MMRLIVNLAELAHFGSLLKKGIANDVRDAAKSGWDTDLVQAIQDDVRKYFKLASRFALYLGALAFIPFIFVIIFLAQQKSYPVFFIFYAFWVSALGLFALWLFSPTFIVVPALRKLPETVYRDLIGTLWLHLDILNISISVALVLFIVMGLNVATSLPIVILVALIWLVGPWAAYLAKRDALFIKIRVGQFSLLLAIAFLAAASPVPMRHYQWWAQSSGAKKMRPTEQREVTADWATLQWFSPEGAPNVWYSSSVGHGYRLFTSPGHDPDTNENLKPVVDIDTKEEIVGKFRAAQLSQIRAEQGKHIQEQTKTFLMPGRTPEKVKTALLLFINTTPDEKAAAWLSAVLAREGISTDSQVFSKAFAASSLFNDLRSGGNKPSPNGFNPADYCENILVGDITVTFIKQAQLADVLTADLVFRLRLISSADGRLIKETESHTTGAGFNETAAQKLAMERIESQIHATAAIIK